jgi:CBS domain-containing protein
MNVAAILKLKGKEGCTTTPETTLLDITKLLGLHGIGCIVITDSDGKVIGIVSERDIVREIARTCSKVLKERVETCMTKAVVTCRESDTIDRLMAEMTAHRFRHRRQGHSRPNCISGRWDEGTRLEAQEG